MDGAAAASADQPWQVALRVRKHLVKKIEKLRPDSAAGADLALLEAIDGDMEKFRLACVSTIFFDFDFAVEQNAENLLWYLHTTINTEYRRILGGIKGSSHVVERRKVEKMYNNFLRIAQKFYKGYIQRLAARYDVPELKRMAQGIDVEQVVADDAVSPVPAELNAKVLASCHLTLIRLGDLTRYRTNIRQPKKSGYDLALVYYSLAHDLVPSSGFATHQMGIIYHDGANHLDIVYYFYRSLVVKDPHPNARLSLEAEFKKLQLPEGSSSRNRLPAPANPQDAFAMWFVRLHALFYKGEISSKHEELEEEVLHRLQLATRDDLSASVLLKMALVNMSAYHIASARFTESGSATASRFCHFVLRFNVRFLRVICGVLEEELRDPSAMNSEPLEAVEQAAAAGTPMDRLLCLLRTYVVWLSACRHDVLGAAESFSGIMYDMLTSLAQVFTLLCAKSYDHQQDLAPCPYLLPEDLDARGLLPLRDEVIPEACRFHCTEDGQTKPRMESPEQQLTNRRASLARILDILRGAYFMAEDPIIPLGYRVEQDSLVFEYQPDQFSHLQNMPAASHTHPATNMAEVKPISEQNSPVASPHLGEVVDDSELRSPFDSDFTHAHPTAAVDDADKTVIDMLAPFLRPPTPQNAGSARDTSSQGMQRSMSYNSFGVSSMPEPSPQGLSRKLEPLPWDWVFTPTPHKSNGQDQMPSPDLGGFPTHRGSFHSPRASLSGAAQFPDDPFVSPHRQSIDALARQGSQGLGSPSADESHRNNLLRSFAGANPANNVPRLSVSSGWPHDTTAHFFAQQQQHYQQPQPQQQQQHQQNLLAQFSPTWPTQSIEHEPPATDTSHFSHLGSNSSIYAGTPGNGVPNGYDWAANGPAPQAEQMPAARQFQMSETTSSYDAAVLQSAYQGR